MAKSDHVMARKGDTFTIRDRDGFYKSLSVAKSLDGDSIELFVDHDRTLSPAAATLLATALLTLAQEITP
jgi:hypothetical protein